MLSRWCYLYIYIIIYIYIYLYGVGFWCSFIPTVTYFIGGFPTADWHMADFPSRRFVSEFLGIALVLGSLLAWLSAVRAFASASARFRAIARVFQHGIRFKSQSLQVATAAADDLTAQVPLALLPTFVIYRWAGGPWWETEFHRPQRPTEIKE